MSLKTELEGALRFNGQLDKETSTNVGEGDNGKEATGEIKSMNIEASSAASFLNMPRLTALGLYFIWPCWCDHRCFSDGQR